MIQEQSGGSQNFSWPDIQEVTNDPGGPDINMAFKTTQYWLPLHIDSTIVTVKSNFEISNKEYFNQNKCIAYQIIGYNTFINQITFPISPIKH